VGFLYERYAAVSTSSPTGCWATATVPTTVTQTVFLRLLTKLDRYEPRERPFEGGCCA
jgi:hypothetical protein